jgi:hypothetical protein
VAEGVNVEEAAELALSVSGRRGLENAAAPQQQAARVIDVELARGAGRRQQAGQVTDPGNQKRTAARHSRKLRPL